MDKYRPRPNGNVQKDYSRTGNSAPQRKRKRKANPGRIILSLVVLLLIAAIAVGALYVAGVIDFGGKAPNVIIPPGTSAAPGASAQPEQSGETATPDPTPEPTPTPVPDPYAVAGTQPSDFGLETAMQLDGADISTYQRAEQIVFGDASEYTQLEGVITFRGNNYRNDPTYGNIGSDAAGRLDIAWTIDTPDSIKKSDGESAWFGCGWTGQPLIVRWPQETVDVMNIYDAKKGKEGLTEVIYATEGSYIYFLDLEDGSFTRDKVSGKWTFKGAGALDPRGYPLLYVGAGDEGPNGPAENMIISLIDCAKIYSYGADDPFSLRNFKAFDGSTAVDAETDTVTYASESGIVYQFKLNTVYDPAAGTISIDPSDIFKMNYSTARSREGGQSAYWLGFESSPIFWRNYMYVSDNGGNLFCIDVNTMEVVWMQDVLDDTNCTPVFEVEEENSRAYIYIGTSTHWTVNRNEVAHIPFWKIDAVTGEKVWTAEGYDCRRNSAASVSGGIQDTAALGREELSGLVYVTYARIVDEEGGNAGSVLVAYNKADGSVAWSQNIGGCSWSSPVAVYDEGGHGFIVQCSSSGMMYLFDGLTGEKLSELELEGNFEASPAVFEDMIVVGTRGQKIYGIKIS